MKKLFLNLAVAAGLLLTAVSSLRAFDEVSTSGTGGNKDPDNSKTEHLLIDKGCLESIYK